MNMMKQSQKHVSSVCIKIKIWFKEVEKRKSQIGFICVSGSTNGFLFLIIFLVVVVRVLAGVGGGWGQLWGWGGGFKDGLLCLLFRHAVDAPEGDGVVRVLHGPPAPGDGVVIVPLVRFLLNQATLAVNICNSKYKLRLRMDHS